MFQKRSYTSSPIGTWIFYVFILFVVNDTVGTYVMAYFWLENINPGKG